MNAEHALVRAARDTALAARGLGEVEAGLALVERLKTIRVTSRDEAEWVTDAVRQVKVAARAHDAKVDTVRLPIKAALDALRVLARPIEEALAAAEKAGKSALIAWTQAERMRQAKAKEDADRAAAQAATAAAQAGEDAPPPAETYIPDDARRVSGTTGSAHTVKVLKCELVNHHDAEPEWLRLDEAAAKAAWRESGAPLGTWKGVRYWQEETVAIR